MEIVVECPCLFFVSKIRANTAKHLLEKMLEMGNAKGNWPMNNRLDFFKRLTAFLLAMLLVTTMMGDDFFSLATSDEIITEESVETDDSSSAPEAAPAPEAVDIPQEPVTEEQQAPSEQGQVVEPTTADSEIPVEPQPTVDENGNPIVVPTEEQSNPETPSEPKESIDDAEVTPNPENIDKPETDKTNEEDIEDPDAKDKEEGIDDEEAEDEEELVKEEEEECEHDWDYVSNGDGTHIRKCTKCDEEGEQEDCDYDENGVCRKCGYEDNSLVFQTFSKEILGTTVTVEGNMPRNADVTIYYVGKKAIENIVNDSLEEGVFKAYAAYDITIYDRYGNKYQPDYDNNAVKVTFESVHKLDEVPDEEVTVFRIEDDNTVTEIEADASGEDVSFDAEHFSIYVTGTNQTVPYMTVALGLTDGFGYIKQNDAASQTSPNPYIRLKKAKFAIYADDIENYQFRATVYKNVSTTTKISEATAVATGTASITPTAIGKQDVEIELSTLPSQDDYIAYNDYYAVIINLIQGPSSNINLVYGTGDIPTFVLDEGWQELEQSGVFIEDAANNIEVLDKTTDTYSITSITGPDPSSATTSGTKLNPYATGEKDSYLYSKGDKGTFVANLSNAAATRTIKWSSGNPSVIEVNENTGEFVAKKSGTTTVKATYTNASGDKEKEINVTVIEFTINEKDPDTQTASIAYSGVVAEPAVVAYQDRENGSKVTVTASYPDRNINVTNSAKVAITYTLNGKSFVFNRTFAIEKIELVSSYFTDATNITVENGVITDISNIDPNGTLAATAKPVFNKDFTATIASTTTSLEGLTYSVRINAVANGNFKTVDGGIIWTKSTTDNVGITAEIVSGSTFDPYVYTGTAITLPENWSEVVTFRNGNGEVIDYISKNTAEYKITDRSGATSEEIAKNAGDKTLVFTITSGGLTGIEIKVDFVVVKADISKATINWKNQEFLHDGKEHKAAPGEDFTVSFNEQPLVYNTDYTVDYSPTGNYVDITGSSNVPQVIIKGAGNNFDSDTKKEDADTTYKIVANFAMDAIVRIRVGSTNYDGTTDKNYVIPYTKVYDGNSTAPNIILMMNGTTYTEGTDYTKTVVDKDGTTLSANVGTKVITITPLNTDISRLKGQTTKIIATYEVGKRPLTTSMVDISNLLSKEIRYTGSAIDVVTASSSSSASDSYDVKVSYNGNTLNRDSDYKLTCENNVNVSSTGATFTIEGMGNYTGTLTSSNFKFNILPAIITKDTGDSTKALVSFADPVDNIVYTGTEKKPKVQVYLNNKPVSNDYSVVYDNNTAVGTDTATATVTGSGNLTGTVILPFSIKSNTQKVLSIKIRDYPADYLQGRDVPNGEGITRYYTCKIPVEYTGSDFNGSVSVYYDDKKLTYRTDYTYAYVNAKNAKDYDTDVTNTDKSPYVLIQGKGNYKNSFAKVLFSIKPIDISSETVQPTVTFTEKDSFAKRYTGSPVELENLVVNVGTKPLTMSTDGITGDYTVTYNDDKTSAGEKSITITGINNYRGSLTKNYTVGTNLNKAKVAIYNPYDATDAFVTLSENTSTKDNPFTAYWRNNKEPIVKLYGENGAEIGNDKLQISINSSLKGDNPTEYPSRKTADINDTNYNLITYTATATAAAEGYYGSTTVYYEIQPQSILANVALTNNTSTIYYDGGNGIFAPEFKYTYGGTEPYSLVGGTDFVPENIDLGKSVPQTADYKVPTVSITGVGNFKDTYELNNLYYKPGYVKIEIEDKGDVKKTVNTADDVTQPIDTGIVYIYNGENQVPSKINVKNTNAAGTPVAESNYTVTMPTESTEVGTYTITVNITGANYENKTVKLTYKIIKNTIDSNYTVNIGDITYTNVDGGVYTADIIKHYVDEKSLKLTVGVTNKTLTYDKDYEIVTATTEITKINEIASYAGVLSIIGSNSTPSGGQTNWFFIKGKGTYDGYLQVFFNIVLDLNSSYAKVTIPNHYYNLKEDGLTTTNPVVPDIKYLAQDKTTWVSLDKPEDNCTVIRSADKKNSPGPDPNLAVEGKNICKNTATEVKYYDTSTNTSYPVCFRADLANLAEQGIIKLTSGTERAYTGSPVTATVSGLGDAVEMKSDALQGDYSIVYTTDPTAINTSVEPIAVKTYYVVVKAPAANIWQSQYFIPESNTGNKLSFKIKYDLSTATIKYYHNGQVVNDNTIPYEGRPMPVPAIITVGSDNVPIYNYNNSDNPLVSLNESTVELVGKYTIIATPKDENQVCGRLISPDFYVSGIDINRCTVTLTHPSVPYTGNPIEESAVGVTVKFNDKTLTRNTDYTLDFVNNLDAGTATINLKGINGYSGVYANPITFTITPVEITSEMVSVETGYYQGYDQEVKPAVTIKNGNHTLLLDTDYKLGDYNNNKAITTENTKASVIIKAGTSGNYKVTNPNGLKIEYDILQLDLATAKIQIDPKSAEWTGEELKVEDIIKSVTTSSGIVLRSEKDDSTAYDYIIKVLNNANTKTMLKEQGTYQLRIEGKNNCTGYLQVPFEITARSLANNYHYYYSSSSTSTGFIGTWTYMQDLDGDTTNGAQPGYITQGSYTDSNGNDVPECLTIKVYDCTTVNDGVDNIPKVEIVDSGVKDSGKDYQLVSGTDFTVSVTNAKTAGSAIWNRTVTADKHATVADGCPTVTITGTGRYMDSISIPFNIGKNINNLGLTVVYTITGAVDVANTAISKPTYTYVEANKDKAAWAYTYNGVEQKPTNISVKYKPVGATSEVPLSTDNYDISYENVNGNEDASVDAGYKYITITGKGDYCGTISQRYQINRKSITAIINKTNNNFPANKVFTNENPMIATSDGTATGKKVLSFAVSGSSVSRMTGSSTTTNTAKTYLVDTKKMNQTEADKFAGYYYAVYDKDPIKPTVTVTDHTLGIHGTSSAVLTDKDIELTYANNNKVSEFVIASNAVSNYTPAIINVSFKGSAANDFTSGGNYYVPEGTTSTYQIEFLIVIHNLSKDFYAQLLNETGDELTEPNFKYDNGKAFRPKVKVTNGTQVLTEGQDNDYILEYENNVRPGEATVTVTGVNNYMGTKTLHYTIWADLADTEIYYKSEGVYVQGTPEQLYTGKAIDYGVPRIYLALPIENNVTEIKPLIEGKDYYAINPKSDNAFLTGGSITYRGSTKYWVGDKGPIDYKVTFDKSLIDVDGITEGQEFKYTGDVIKPEMTLNVSTAKAEPTIYYRNYGKENQELLDSDDDFVKIGTITAVIKYKLGEESGEIEKTYKIVPRPIYDCKVVYTENNRYTGYQIKPSVSVFIVSDNGVKTLEEGTQYKVEYGENIYSLCTLKVTGCCDEITSSKTYFPKINLGAPVNLKTTADGSSVTATWVHDIYTAGEEVEIIKASTNELIALKKIEGTKGTCTFDGLENVTNYIVKIRSYQYIGESKELKYSSDWDNAKQSSVTTGIATSEMSVESNAVGKVTIKWDPDGDVVIYKIYRAESADASDKGTKIAVFPASTGVYTNSNLDKKSPYVSDYWYYIEGYAIINNELTLVSTSEKMHVTVMQ